MPQRKKQQQRALRPLPNRLVLVLLVVFCAVLGTLGAYFLYSDWYILGQYTVETHFQVTQGSNIGFNLNNSALNFGRVPQGGGASRGITLSSQVPATAHITVDPPIDAWLVPVQKEVLLPPGTPVTVPFNLDIPLDAALGNYTGTVTLLYTRRLW